MGKEYLQQQDMEAAKKRDASSKGNVLEKTVQKGVSPESMQKRVLHNPAIMKHAQVCNRFGITSAHVSGHDFTFTDKGFEDSVLEHEAQLQPQLSSQPSPSKNEKKAPLEETIDENKQSHDHSSRETFGKMYGVSTDAAQCNCGKEIKLEPKTSGLSASDYTKEKMSDDFDLKKGSEYSTGTSGKDTETQHLYGNTSNTLSQGVQQTYTKKKKDLFGVDTYT